MSTATQTRNVKVVVFVDNCDWGNPREWDCLSTLAVFSKRYKLGDGPDKIPYELRPENFSSWDELEDYLVKELDAVIVYPVYMLDHGMVCLRLRDFADVDPTGFDWGRVGVLFVTKERIREYFGVKRITRNILKRAEDVALAEFREYNAWLTGEVYGFKIVEEKYCPCCERSWEEIVDCVGGFIIPGSRQADISKAILSYINPEQLPEDLRDPENWEWPSF